MNESGLNNNKNLFKDEIIELFKREDMINKITISRVNFSTNISEFYFFQTFILALQSVGITAEVHNNILPSSGISDISNIKNERYITFIRGNEYLKVNFDTHELNNKLNSFNLLQKDMGMKESTIALIDIFLSLLV